MSVYIEGCSEDFCIFSFYFRYSIPCILVLWPFWHTLYLNLIYIYIDVCYSPISPCVATFLSLYTCFLYIVCNLLFLFQTKMPWWVLFKVFQKYKLSKLSCHKLSSCKVFQVFVLGYILMYSISEYELNDLWLLSYLICLLWFCYELPKGEIVRTYAIDVRNICQHFM